MGFVVLVAEQQVLGMPTGGALAAPRSPTIQMEGAHPVARRIHVERRMTPSITW